MLEAIAQFDAAAIVWIHDHIQTPWLDPVMWLLSSFAILGVALSVIALFFLWRDGDRGRMLIIAALLLALLTDQVASHILKPLVHRVRPHGGSSYSFPSVHATNTMAQAVFSHASIHDFPDFFIGVAIVVGFSRLYLEKHWPSDVLAGALLGGVLGYAMSHAVLRWGNDATRWVRSKLRARTP